jgi:uncharacterized protein (DUF362 family)
MASGSSRGPSPVAIARVSGAERDASAIRVATGRALELLGGARRWFPAGSRVFLKPNQTAFIPADHGATTDPAVLQALVSLALEAGASRVQVGDMPGAGISAREVMRVTGVAAAVTKAGGEPVYLDEAQQATRPVPNGKIVTELRLPAPLLEADVVVNVPKAKTHFVDRISGAVKNWMGAMRPDVRRMHHDVETPHYVCDALSVRPPDLHVLDAVIAGEGNGPGATIPRWVGCVLASPDPVALDVTAARVLGFDPAGLLYARIAEERGLGTRDPSRIQILGAPIEEVRTPLRPTDLDLSFRYLAPVRVLVGEDVSMPGTVGHFKFVADLWHRDHAWELIRRARGTPTFLLGRTEDPDFEAHVAEGPYVTIDDTVPDRYKRDPRVHHIPGHPVTDQMFSALVEALGVKLPAMTALELSKFWDALRVRASGLTAAPPRAESDGPGPS